MSWQVGLRRGVVLSIAALAALSGDALIILAVVDDLLPAAFAVMVHGVLAVGVGLLVSHWLGDRLTALVLGLWVALLGPFGALASWAALIFAARSKATPLEDEQWYQRLRGSEATDDELITALRDERAYQAEGVSLHSFREIMERGTVGQKQTILGLIAQSYEPALFGFLMDALRSHEVAVRASAAAVFARLRDKQAADLRKAEELALSTDLQDVLEAATILAEAAASRLMPERDAADARRRSLALRKEILRSDVVPLSVKTFDRQLKGMAQRKAEPGSSVATPSAPLARNASSARRQEGLS